MMDNTWTVKNGQYIAIVDVDQLGHMSTGNLRRLLRLSATGEHPEEFNALAHKLAQALKSAQDRVLAFEEAEDPDDLLSEYERSKPRKERQRLFHTRQTEARRNLSGLKKALEVYSFKNY